jgi:hypothetical protein
MRPIAFVLATFVASARHRGCAISSRERGYNTEYVGDVGPNGRGPIVPRKTYQ